MDFKVGQRVIAVARGTDAGHPRDGSQDSHWYDYEIGWKGTVTNDDCDVDWEITFDNGKVMHSCMFENFKVIKEVEFTVGTKVTVTTIGRNAGAMEFKDGTLYPSGSVKYEVGIGSPIAVYEVTGGIGDQTVIRRISDGRVFFVKPEFLKEYIPEPKFKRGDFVHRGNRGGFYRVSSSEVIDGNVYCRITQYLDNFNDGDGLLVCEDELREAK